MRTTTPLLPSLLSLFPLLPLFPLHASAAAALTLSIPPSLLLPNPSLLPPSTHATLFGPSTHLSAPLSRTNTLTFHNLSANSYLLNIHCRDYWFEPLRVDVRSAAAPGEAGHKGEVGHEGEEGNEVIEVWQTFVGSEWDNKGALRGRSSEGGRLVLDVVPVGRKEYYQERQGFAVLSFLRSPVILMGVFSMVLVFGMPYLMENMDDETKAEFAEMQKKSPMAANPAASIQNFDLASWMAGKTSGAGAAAAAGEKQGGAKAR